MPYMIDPKVLLEHLRPLLEDAIADQDCSDEECIDKHLPELYWLGWKDCYDQIIKNIDFVVKYKIWVMAK